MPAMTKASRWRVIARSEQGASHMRNNLPNQDAVKALTSPDGTPPIIIAVADGHGSPKSFRSDVGASFAVDSAVSACSEFLERIKDASASEIKNSAEQQIPRRIIDRWKHSVAEHFTANPFSAKESELVAKERYLVAYGTTILLAAISEQFLLFFQLGDGEILVVSDGAVHVVRPIPRDEALIANETTSLCMDNPLPEFRFRFQYVSGLPPGIILLSTDGYPNSFRSHDGFIKVGTDLLEILRMEGGDSVERDLSDWLRESSAEGSGDDVTVGVIYRLEPPLDRPCGVACSAKTPAFSTVEPRLEPLSGAGTSMARADRSLQPPVAIDSSLATPTAQTEPCAQPMAPSAQIPATCIPPIGRFPVQAEQDSAIPPEQRGSSTLHEEGASIQREAKDDQ